MVVIEKMINKQIIKREEIIPIKNLGDLSKVNQDFNLNIVKFDAMVLIVDNCNYSGYFAFKYLFINSNNLLQFVFRLPLSDIIGPIFYKYFAKNRSKFKRNSECGLH